MDNTNLPNALPGVFLRLLQVLDQEKDPIAWKLSKAKNGKTFLWISHFPAQLEQKSPSKKNGHKLSQEQELTNAVLVTKTVPPKRKKKSPSQLKRDRERWNQWRQKSRANSDPVSSLVKHVADPKVLETPASPKDTANEFQELTTHLDHQVMDSLPEVSPETGAAVVQACYVDSCEESDIDSDADLADLINFCANCHRKSESVEFKKCSKCKLSQYCSVKCQRENWSEHKIACSIVAKQRSGNMDM